MERDEKLTTESASIVPRKIAGDVLARAANDIFQIARALVILPLISRLFGAAAYGIWAQIGATLLLFVPILHLRMGTALVRFTAGYSAEEKAQATYSALLVTLVIGFAVLAVGIPARRALAIAMFANADLSAYALLFLGLLVARAGSSVALDYHHAHSRITFYTTVEGGLALLELLGLLTASWIMKSSFETAILVIVAINVVAFLALFVDILRRERTISFSAPVLAKLLRYSLPLVPAVALAWVVSAGDRYVIVHYLGLEQSGTYSAAYRVAQVLGLAVQPMLFVLFPLVSSLWDKGERERAGRYLSDAMHWYVILAIPATAGLVAIGSSAMKLIAGGVFATSDLLIFFLAASELIVGVSLIYNQALFLQEMTWVQPLLLFGIGGLNLGLNFLWVPRIGILGSAMATCICRLVQMVIVVSVARHLVHAPIPWSVIVKATIVSIGVYLVAAFLPISGGMGLALRFLAGAVTFGVLAIGLRLVRKGDFGQLIRK
jgi:O-antigen/teichoic acid export membrane protein